MTGKTFDGAKLPVVARKANQDGSEAVTFKFTDPALVEHVRSGNTWRDGVSMAVGENLPDPGPATITDPAKVHLVYRGVRLPIAEMCALIDAQGV